MRKLVSVILFVCLTQWCYSQPRMKVLSHNRNKDTCNWNINLDSVEVILNAMTPLAGPTHHCCYNNFSCGIDGEVVYKGEKYKYTLNAGGWVSLWRGDYKESFLFACTKKQHFKYFLSTYDVSGYRLRSY